MAFPKSLLSTAKTAATRDGQPAPRMVASTGGTGPKILNGSSKDVKPTAKGVDKSLSGGGLGNRW